MERHWYFLVWTVIGCLVGVACAGPTNSSQVTILQQIAQELPALTTLPTDPWTAANIENACNLAIHGVQACDAEGWVVKLDWWSGIGEVLGEAPDSIGQMERLTYLSFSGTLNGTWPVSWRSLTQLQVLYLVSNPTVGQIPDEWSEMAALTSVTYNGGSIGNMTIPTWIGSAWQELKRLAWSYAPLIGEGADYEPLGSLPKPELPDFAGLDQLEEFLLLETGYRGAIPASLAMLPNLVSFDVRGNYHLEGPFPSDWTGCTKLLQMTVSRSWALQASLPSALPNSTRTLIFEHTPWEGDVPSSMVTSPSLRAIRMTNLTGITGSFPFASLPPSLITFGVTGCPQLEAVFPSNLWTLIPKTTYFSWSVNGLSGPNFGLPSFPSNCALQTLTISSLLLNGPIDESISRCVNLTTLALEFSSLSGDIPRSILTLSKLNTLALHHNQLTGTILGDDWLGLSRLRTLMTNSNYLTGTISETIVALANSPTGIRSLYLDDNELDLCGNPAISLTNNITGIPSCSVLSQRISSCGCRGVWSTCPAGGIEVNPACCPLPKPIPLEAFTCNPDGNWILSQPVVDTPVVLVSTPVTIQGNLTVDTITFSGAGSLINVTGCLAIEESITLELTPEELQSIIDGGDGAKIDLLTSSGCSIDDLSSVPISLTINGVGGCEKVSVSSSTTSSSLSAIFTIDRSECGKSKSKTWWIVLISVVGGVLLIGLILALVFTLNPKARDCIRPYADRKKQP